MGLVDTVRYTEDDTLSQVRLVPLVDTMGNQDALPEAV